ncbi:MAG: MIP/aquaporin family protein [Metamycoplasmataceae bacterium]
MGDLDITQLFQYGASELVGTLLLILLGNGVVATCVLNGTKGKASGWLTITFGWFAAIFVSVMVAKQIGSYSHEDLPTALLNPVFVITNMMIYAKDNTAGLPFDAGMIAILFQIIGAALGQILVWLTFKKHYDATEDPGTILATFSTGPAIRSIPWNFVTEVIATMVLVFAVSSIGAVGETASGDAVNAEASFYVGLIVFSIGISLGSATGYSLNPFRDLIPRIVHQLLPLKNKGSSDWSYALVPTVGPIVGGIIGVLAAPGLFY